jgi:hypothetical protein
MWARQFRDGDAPRGGPLESRRWIESYEIIAEQALKLSQTRHVFVGDRESDMLALMVRAKELKHAADYLVRCQHNRALPQGAKLWDRVMKSEHLGGVVFSMPAGRGRKARTVEQEIRLERVSMGDGRRGQIEVTCLIASEINPSPGAKPVVWRLLTNRMASTLQAACELIDWYRARWEIEMFFNVLKESCRVEQLQLGDTGRLQTALALRMIIAWRINRLMRLGRTLPDSTADLLLKRYPRPTPSSACLPSLGGFWAERAMGSPVPRPSGWACGILPSLCKACATPVNSGSWGDLCITRWP